MPIRDRTRAMVLYRRNRVPGASYFFTVTLRDRRSDVLVRHIDLLKNALRQVRGVYPRGWGLAADLIDSAGEPQPGCQSGDCPGEQSMKSRIGIRATKLSAGHRRFGNGVGGEAGVRQSGWGAGAGWFQGPRAPARFVI